MECLEVGENFYYARSGDAACLRTNFPPFPDPGASQRYVNEDTSNLKDQKEEIMERVVDFFERVVQKKVELSSYCFDLFISRDLKPIVIDIGPLDEERLPSDRLLDLISPEEAEQHPSEKSLYGFPVDFLDMV